MNTSHNFQPLRAGRPGDASGTITIVCAYTHGRSKWNDAVLDGWVADLNGPPFKSYYSPAGKALLLLNEEMTRKAIEAGPGRTDHLAPPQGA